MDFSEYQSNLDAFNNAKEQLSNLVDQGRELISGKQSTLDKFATVLQQGGDISGQVLGSLGAIGELAKGTALEKSISSLKDQLATLRQNVTDGIQKGVESGIDKATTAARNIAGDNPTANALIDSASSGTRQVLTNAVTQASGGDMSGALNTLQSGAAKAATTGSDTIKLGAKAAKDAGTELLESGSKAASDAASSATTTVNQTLSMARNTGARAANSVTGNLPEMETFKLNVGKTARTLSRRVKGSKQAAKQAEEPTTEQQTTLPEGYLTRNTPLGDALGSEDLAMVVRQQVKAGTVDPDTLRVVKETEPDLLKPGPSTETTTAAPSTTAPSTVEQSGLPELPDFPGLSDIPKVNLPDLPGLSDIFGLAPKTAVAEAQSVAANLAPKLGSAEATVAQLGGAMGKIADTASGVAKSTADALTQAPSKVLGIANKGMRGDSTLARALRMNQSEKPVSVKPTEPARILPEEQMKMPTMEDFEAATKGGFADPSETVLSKFIPAGRSMDSIGDLESYHIATGIPKDVLAQARATEGKGLIKSPQIRASDLDNTAPQARIKAPEPSAEPEGARPQTTTATPNNPTLKPQEPTQPTQAPKPAPKSEIEPAEGPTPSTTTPSTGTTAPSTETTAPSTGTTTPSTTLPKPAGAAAEGGEIAEGGGATVGETAVEGGAALGPEGLLVGALVAGVTSLIGGLIKDFTPSHPSMPTFANTGVSFANQQQISSGTAF